MKPCAGLTRITTVILSAALLLTCLSVCQAKKSKKWTKPYAIVVSKATYSDSAWAEVVNKLKAKYNAQVFVYDFPNIESVRKQLSDYMPWYICVVAKPNEADRNLLRKASDTIKRLDDDPYEDSIWAVMTGYTAADAMRMVNAKNLTITKALSGVGDGWLNWFDSGLAFSECTQNMKTIKEHGKPAQSVHGPDDTTEEIVQALNTNQYQIMSSSGHATEHDWRMGYTYKNGAFRCKDGNLYGLSSTGKRYDISTTNSKIYFSPGNCLIGHIPGDNCDCMSLAWMHNGANQFFGHIVIQGQPCWAWSMVEYFFGLQDRFSFAETAYIYSQTLQFETAVLGHEYPCCTRDTKGTGFYGDPAWNAKIKKVATPVYDQDLKIKKIPNSNKYKIVFTVTVNTNGKLQSHPVALLPSRFQNYEIKKTDAEKVITTDNFIIMQIQSDNGPAFKKGDTRSVELVAEPCTKWRFVE
ncbi:MAG: hypothetical protein ABFD64_10020 [Armatimonadota bacterium]